MNAVEVAPVAVLSTPPTAGYLALKVLLRARDVVEQRDMVHAGRPLLHVGQRPAFQIAVWVPDSAIEACRWDGVPPGHGPAVLVHAALVVPEQYTAAVRLHAYLFRIGGGRLLVSGYKTRDHRTVVYNIE